MNGLTNNSSNYVSVYVLTELYPGSETMQVIGLTDRFGRGLLLIKIFFVYASQQIRKQLRIEQKPGIVKILSSVWAA